MVSAITTPDDWTRIATLGIAVLGLCLSVASLVWQATTFRLSGPRVRVELRVGATNGQTYATMPLKQDWYDSVIRLQQQGMGLPIIAVMIRNVGRQATSVVNYAAALDTGISFGMTSPPRGCKPLPHRLEAEDQILYYVELEDCLRLAHSVQFLPKKPSRLHMTVDLGSGKTLKTEQSIPARDLLAMVPREWRERNGDPGL